MLQVPIDKIIPLTEARDSLSKIIADVEGGTPLYILTKNGKPSVAIMAIDALQKQVGPVSLPTAESSHQNTSVAEPVISAPSVPLPSASDQSTIALNGRIPSAASGAGPVVAPDSSPPPATAQVSSPLPEANPASAKPPTANHDGYEAMPAQYGGSSSQSSDPEDMPVG